MFGWSWAERSYSTSPRNLQGRAPSAQTSWEGRLPECRLMASLLGCGWYVCVCFDEVNRGGNGMRPASFAHRTHLLIACRSRHLPTRCRLRACDMEGEVGLRVARILSGSPRSFRWPPPQHASAVTLSKSLPKKNP